jgi:Uma2 family endonuclease
MPALTLEQFLCLEETEPASEFVCGNVYRKPMADVRHASLQAYFAYVLHSYLADKDIGRGLMELLCIFGPAGRERAYVPDLVYVSNERLSKAERYLYAAPDLVIEILSPDQHWPQLIDKVQFYLLYGVRLVWVVDPETAAIAVQTPGEEGRVLASGDMLDGGDVLPGFSVAVDDIFAQIQL